MAGWLAAVSSEQPSLLVLDDVQWAAKPTLLLLRHVLHSAEPMRLMVVATYRDTDIGRGHPLGELLADLRRDTGVDRIALSGLTVAGVVGYMEAASGHALNDEDDTALALAIHDETDGNPFFLREVLRHLVETGEVAERDGRWSPTVDIDRLGIPEGVRDVVGRRLSRLSDRANQALTAAAVIGTAFDVALVGPVCGLDDDEVLAALEEAEGARIVAEVASAAPRYRFAHRLVRDTLYDELSAGRRARLNQRAAEAIESVHAGRLGEHLSALANHYSRAAAPAGETADKAVDYAVQAGERALAQLAHDEAVAWYHRALDLIDGATGFDEAARLDVLVALGEAQQRASDPAHRDTLLEAARTAQQLGRTDVLGTERHWPTPGRSPSAPPWRSTPTAWPRWKRRSRPSATPTRRSGPSCWPTSASNSSGPPTPPAGSNVPTRRSPWPVGPATLRCSPGSSVPASTPIWSPDHAFRTAGHHHGTARVGRRSRGSGPAVPGRLAGLPGGAGGGRRRRGPPVPGDHRRSRRRAATAVVPLAGRLDGCRAGDARRTG